MKILICIGRLYMGGIEKYAIDLASGLKEKGHIINLIVFYQVTNQEKLYQFRKIGVHVHEINVRSGRDIRLPLKFYQLLQRVKPEIVHLNGLPLLAFLALYMYRTNTVYTVHQMVTNKLISSMYKNLLDGVICVSNAVSKGLRNNGIFPESKFVIIYHGMRTPNKRTQFVPGQEIELLMVSRLAQDKHPDQAVEVMRYLVKTNNQYRLTFVGAGDVNDDAYIADIKTKISDYNLEEKIRFVGWQENVYQFMEDAQGLLVLSDSESFGYSAIEAMAHGIPIFSYYIEGGMHEFHQDEHTGIVAEVRDPKRLAQAVAELFENPIRWNRMSENALEMSTNFSIVKMVNRTESFYRDLLNDTT